MSQLNWFEKTVDATLAGIRSVLEVIVVVLFYPIAWICEGIDTLRTKLYLRARYGKK